VSVLQSTGSGFLPVAYVAGDQPSGLVAGDIDGDGKIDIGVGSWWDVSILLNRSH
jgi:hypothetical protein